MKQIKKVEGLIGKKIAQIIMPKEHYDDLWIKFTDGSFVVFDVNDISVGFENSKYLMTIETMDKDKTEEELLELGLISPQEHTNALQQEKIRREEYHAQYEQEQQESQSNMEKEQLKKLLKKYPNLDKDIK